MKGFFVRFGAVLAGLVIVVLLGFTIWTIVTKGGNDNHMYFVKCVASEIEDVGTNVVVADGYTRFIDKEGNKVTIQGDACLVLDLEKVEQTPANAHDL